MVVKVGDRFTNKYGTCEVIEWLSTKNVKIKWLDDFGHEMYSQTHSIERGAIKNPYYPALLGVGYVGVGPHLTSKNNKPEKPYYVWKAILTRCYDERKRAEWPSYQEVEVCSEWHNFQNFAEWYKANYVEDWFLDKDILVKGNKIYSPETCCFVPAAINSMFTKANSIRGEYPIGVHRPTRRPNLLVASCNNGTGKSHVIGRYKTVEEAFSAYKDYKEALIKEVANKYKDLLAPRVYEILLKYEVNPDD